MINIAQLITLKWHFAFSFRCHFLSFEALKTPVLFITKGLFHNFSSIFIQMKSRDVELVYF